MSVRTTRPNLCLYLTVMPDIISSLSQQNSGSCTSSLMIFTSKRKGKNEGNLTANVTTFTGFIRILEITYIKAKFKMQPASNGPFFSTFNFFFNQNLVIQINNKYFQIQVKSLLADIKYIYLVVN